MEKNIRINMQEMKELLYNNKNKTFIVTKETFEVYKSIQDDLVRRDLLNHSLYSTDFLFASIKRGSSEVLEKYLSVAHKMLLITYYFNEGMSMSLVQGVSLSHDTHIEALRKALDRDNALLVNSKGGYQPFNIKHKELSGYSPYDWEESNIIDNDTPHLILENAHEAEEGLLDRVESNTSPSIITNFKHIVKSKKVDSFLRKREDWNLWVYTKGADTELYKMFLDAYGLHIESVYVYSPDLAIIKKFKREYPSINFIDI